MRRGFVGRTVCRNKPMLIISNQTNIPQFTKSSNPTRENSAFKKSKTYENQVELDRFSQPPEMLSAALCCGQLAGQSRVAGPEWLGVGCDVDGRRGKRPRHIMAARDQLEHRVGSGQFGQRGL